MTSRDEGELEGIKRSPSFREQFIELQHLIDSEEKRIKTGVTKVTTQGKRTVVEQTAKYVFLGATTAFGSVAISSQLEVQDIVWIFAFLVALGLLGFAKLFDNNRKKVRRKWGRRIDLLFHTYRYRFRTFILRQNKKYRSEDDRIHDHYQHLQSDAFNRGLKQGITIGKEMIEQDFKDEVTVYRQQMSRQAEELSRIKARFSGKIDEICKECPNANSFSVLIEETEKALEPPPHKKRLVRFDI